MKHVAEADFPTRFGNFRIHAFTDEKGEHLALIKGDVNDSALVRIHSKCLTGDTFYSLRCDCRQQLEKALEIIGKEENAVFIYLDQEGRGIGLANKIKAYSLQDKGKDTVDANLELGFCDDLREYDVAADILLHFNIKKIRLMTNNPRKIKGLEEKGIEITERIPLIVKPNGHNKNYLETKKEKLDHMI